MIAKEQVGAQRATLEEVGCLDACRLLVGGGRETGEAGQEHFIAKASLLPHFLTAFFPVIAALLVGAGSASIRSPTLGASWVSCCSRGLFYLVCIISEKQIQAGLCV